MIRPYPWLEFDVHGVPSPQGSKRAYVRNGRANLVEVAGTALKDWRTSVAFTARAAIVDQDWAIVDDGPVEVEILFRMPRPKSRPEDFWHAVRPDIDKLTRAVLDALTTARVWRDDSQVSDLVVMKHYATAVSPPGAMIAVGRTQT